MCNQYNGWTNYSTWNCSLWLGNDEGSSKYWDSVANTYIEESEDTLEAIGALAHQLEREVTEGAPDLGASMFADLLGASMSDINWREIAEHMIEDCG